MAADSLQERTEAPTLKRRQEAAKKGEVPRSQEVTIAVLLLASAAVVAGTGGAIASAAVDLFGMNVSKLSALPVGVEGTAEYVNAVGWKILAAMSPALLIMAGAALTVGAVQARGVLSFDPLQPKWDRLDPFKKAKQIWGWKAPMELLKSLFKLGIVAIVLFVGLRTAVRDIPSLGQRSPFALLATVQSYATRMLLAAGIAYLALALADYAFQLWRHEKQLRMTREDVKKEVKESEGDQVIKVRRRSIGRQMARRRMLLSVSEADVVVTNPTQVAVALKYDPDVASAPTVLAIGERKVAQRIRELAEEAGVPVIENKPLAWALLATAQIGQPIPVDLFLAVAEVLAFVYRTFRMKPRARPSGARA